MDAFERAVKQLQAGHNAEVVRTCRRILRFAPDHSDTWNILGLAQVGLGTLDDAAATFERAIALGAGADAWNNLGSLRKQQARLDEALAAYRHAIESDVSYADAHFNLGTILRDREDLAGAAACFHRAALANPEDREAWYSAGKAMFDLGQISEALAWIGKSAEGGAEMPVSMIATIIPGDPAATNQDVLDARRVFAKLLPPPRPAGERECHHPMRLGYVSSFFDRANWMKPVWPLLRHHDPAKFEVHLFSDGPISYGSGEGERFHDISALSNEAAAELIKRAEIDVLVDLNGYSKVRRLGLIASRPAPVAVGWFNMYATSGMDAYDYLIGDDTVVPLDEERFYSEKIVRVAGSYLTFAVDYPVPDVAPPPWLKNGYVTFGSLASQYKIAPAVVEAWSSILRAMPGSRLILKNATLGSEANRAHVRGLFGDVADRVRVEGPSEHFEFLKMYDEIDIALDTFPYNGGTTTTEAIWQGVPVVAYWGDRWASRTSASILRAAGLGEFVMGSVEEYVAKAIELAHGEGRRIGRGELRASAACDVEGFARNMEALYEQIRSR